MQLLFHNEIQLFMPNFYFSESNNSQFIIGSSDCTVTWYFTVSDSVCARPLISHKIYLLSEDNMVFFYKQRIYSAILLLMLVRNFKKYPLCILLEW